MTAKKVPMWIGAEIETSNGTIKVLIGINQENGNEISFCNDADIAEAEKNGENPLICSGVIVVKEGVDAFVFDENHNLIK